MQKKLHTLTTAATLYLLNVQQAFAAGTGGGIGAMAEPLTRLTETVTGPIATGVTLIGTVMTGMQYFSTHHGPGMQLASRMMVGGGISMKAAAILAGAGLGGAVF